MKLTLESLSARLAERLLPVYLVSGDEPLLVGEAADVIRARARQLGFAEREVFFIERSAAVWDDVRQASQALSLFASRRIVEIRMPSGKPGVAGAAGLLKLLQAAGDELLVLIITDYLYLWPVVVLPLTLALMPLPRRWMPWAGAIAAVALVGTAVVTGSGAPTSTWV